MQPSRGSLERAWRDPRARYVLHRLVAAFVVPAGKPDALTAEQIIEHSRRELAPFKVPRRVEIIDELPVTPLGKVQKYLLRERLTN
jgi:carnitine-CoA ligase